jgi:hypothetical protein
VIALRVRDAIFCPLRSSKRGFQTKQRLFYVVAVQGFKGSEVQGYVLAPDSILEAYVCENHPAS